MMSVKSLQTFKSVIQTMLFFSITQLHSSTILRFYNSTKQPLPLAFAIAFFRLHNYTITRLHDYTDLQFYDSTILPNSHCLSPSPLLFFDYTVLQFSSSPVLRFYNSTVLQTAITLNLQNAT